MSDILLSVGMQKGRAGTSQLEIDVKDVVDRINQTPLKVSVGLEVDQSALDHFRSQLTQIVNSVGLSKGAPITVSISGIGEITTKAGEAKRALDGVAKAGESAADAVKGMKATQAHNALTQINTQLKAIQTNYSKWTAAQNGLSSEAYATYGNQIRALEKLKLQVQSNVISWEKFREQLAAIKSTASEAAVAINKVGEDRAASKTQILVRESESYNTALGQTESLLAQVKKRQEEWTAAKNGKSSDAYDAFAGYQIELEHLIDQLLSSKMAANDFAGAFAKIQAKVRASEGAIKSAGEATKSFGDRIEGLAKKFGTWLSISQVIMMAVRSAKKMVAVVREIDVAMTELKKVTNETDAAYNQFLTKASDRAQQLGASLSDVVAITADFARLGYSIEDASALADTALVYKNIGDGIEDITTASESIISTMQAFGIEASNAISIVDKFNEVGNKFAISSAGIGEAMQRSAAAMASANNTIDETIALITAANTIVQNPESVGTTLKTVSMYLRAAKTEAEEAGEVADGMASSVAELRREILRLTGNRVDIQIDENTFKSTYEILKDLSAVWNDLSDISQANILELVGGKRNANVVAALLENFSVAEDALESSAKAAGSAMRENEKYLDSIQGKISAFKSAFENLSKTLVDSELIKFFVDFGTVALNVMGGLIDQMGGLGTAAAATAMILNHKFGNKFGMREVEISDDVKEIFKDFDILKEDGLALDPKEMWEWADGLKGADENLKSFLESEKYGEKSLDNFNKFMQEQNSGLKGLGKSFKNLGKNLKSLAKSFAIDIAIINTIRAVSDLISLLSNLGNEQTDVFEEFDALSSELSSVESELSSLESELSSVESQIDALLEKGELSFTDQEELSRLRSISRELNHQISLSETLEESLKKSMNGTAIEAFSTYANTTSFSSKQSADERKQEAKAMGSSIGNAFGLIIGGLIGTAAGGNTFLGASIGSAIGSLGGSFIGGAVSDASYANELTVREMLDNMRLERIKLTTAQEEAYEAYTSNRSNKNKEAWNEASAALNDYNTSLASHISQLQNYYNAVDYATLATEKQREEYRQMGDDLDSYNIQMGVVGAKTVAFDRIFDEEQITDDALELKQAIQAAINAGEDIRFYDYNPEQFAETQQRLEHMGLTLTDVIAYFQDLKEAEAGAADFETYDMVENIANLSNGISQLVDAFEEFNEQGILTADTLVKLNAVFGNLGDKWSDYVTTMTSGNATMTEAVGVTQELAEGYLNALLQNGGIQLNKRNESTDEWELDADKYKTYLATINELEVMGVKNAKEYVDALQQQAMIRATVDKMIQDAADRETLMAKESLTADEQAYLDELINKSADADAYIRETENLYGIKIEDTSLIQQQQSLDELIKLSNDFEKYLTTVNAARDEFDNSIQNELAAYDKYYAALEELETWQAHGFGVGPGDGGKWTSWAEVGHAFKDAFTFGAANTGLDEVERLIADINATVDLVDEERASRQQLFDDLVDIANKANIDLSDIDIDSFALNEYGDGSIFDQVYHRVLEGLENSADYEALAEAMQAEIEEQLNDLGLKVDLDLNIDGVVIDKLKSSYGLLETAEAEMNAGTGLSVDTIQALAEETDDYLDYLYEENGLIKLNTELWKERADIAVDDSIQALRNAIYDLQYKQDRIKKNLEYAESLGNTALVEKYTLLLDENTAAIERNEHELEILLAILNIYAESVNTAAAAQNDFTKALSGVQTLQSGFDILAAIYADVSDGGDFDWSSILNNQQFADAFGNLGAVYLDFIETIANSPDDIDACQEAFNNLASAYLLQSDKLVGVTDATRDLMVAMLEQMGVANAAALVDQQLAYNKEYLKYTTGEYADMEYDQIMAMYKTCEAGSAARSVLAQLAAEKLKVNANGIYTLGDARNLLMLAQEANATTETLNRLAQASSLLRQAMDMQAKADATDDFFTKAYYMAQAFAYNTQAQSLINQAFDFNDIDPSQFEGQYTGNDDDATEEKETWFEEQYRLHQHHVAMEQETEEDYLNWLNEAHQRAFEDDIISLDEYYRYQEEVFDGLRNLFKDYLSDVEHEISMRENYEGESDTIIELYKGLMAEVEREIAASRAQGLDDDDEYIQELQKKWQGYFNYIQNIEDSAADSAKDAIDELVDYRLDMIKQDIENERDALNKKLDYLKEFYDEQKKMLQDQYDEEQYLEEQAEKRKSVSDLQSEIAMLENDDSAWAQKRRLELQEELADAEDELKEFEDERALDLALEALDNAYDAQKEQIDAEMTALEERLNDPEALFNQALSEIQNNTGDLYQEMLEFNRRYGTGNDADVMDIYEAAYKVLQEYKDIYGEDYQGVILPNSTDYQPKNGTWDTAGISGTNSSDAPNGPLSVDPPPSDPTVPAIGSTVTVKESATHFGSKSNGAEMASFIPGGSFTVYQTSEDQVLIGLDGVYTDWMAGWINKSDIVGYATGTDNATPGLHRLDEIGSEYLFTSNDGNRYRVLSSGDKVLNAKATEFLYKFANSGGEILDKIIKSALGTSLFDRIRPIVNNNEIHMGDVIVQGSAGSHTVSEIRRAQRDNLTDMLKNLNKLSK